MLTQERLKELFHYDSLTGDFIRKVASYQNRVMPGQIPGSNSNGYLIMSVDNTQYYNHRLVWLYHKGYFPENDIDHINRNKSDNRIENLREVSRSCNNRNMGNPKDNKSGVKGVCWETRGKRWLSTIVVFKKSKYLGMFKNFDEAVCHRLAAEQCLNWEGCDSCSPAYKYVQDMLKKKVKYPRIRCKI